MSDTKVPPRLRSRQCLFVLYPESQQDAIDYCQKKLPCAWALHDKDVYEKDADDGSHKKGDLKKPHYHFVCHFPNARYFSSIAKELGVPENTIRKCNNLYKAYVYLWHMLDPDKYPYDKSIVGTHEFDEPSEHAGMSAAEDDQLQVMFDAPHFHSYAEMARWAYENGCWAVFKKNYALWRDIFAESRRSTPSRTDKLFPDGMYPLNPNGPAAHSF